MTYKNTTHWNPVEESEDSTTFEGSLQSKMIVLLDSEENLLIYALERKEELERVPMLFYEARHKAYDKAWLEYHQQFERDVGDQVFSTSIAGGVSLAITTLFKTLFKLP